MIEIWRADLAAAPGSDEDLRSLLSVDEIARADRFHFDRDRSRFVRRRAFRRMWIGGRLGRDPAGLRFACGIHGKPELADGPETFWFNCSASADRALLAFSVAGEVGVDLEQHRPFEADLPLVMERFAPEELQILKSLGLPARTRMFFECWSRKEALVKAVGSGLYLPLDDFAVPLTPSVSVEPVRWQPRVVDQNPWWISSLDLGVGWSAAVASSQPLAPQLGIWNWEGAERRSR